MEYGTGIYKRSDYIAIKMPVFSFEKIKNADTSLGPEMKSTGEVLGVSKNFSDSRALRFIASGINIPKSGNVLITVRDKDKEEVLPLARKLYNKGFNIYATKGTATFLKNNGMDVTIVEKIWEGAESIPNLLQLGKINFIINTPTRGKEANRDGFKIRRLAAESKIPCFTSLDTANALYDAIEDTKTEEELDVVDITEV